MIDQSTADAPVVTLPPPPARVHFVGIGGIGMSGLARILHGQGYIVSGSDATPSALLDALRTEGMAVAIGHADTERAAAADLLVVTAAVRGDNAEVAAAMARDTPVVKRAALLGLLANGRVCVAVAGSHGKSTTSGMLVAALQALDADPSYAIGAVLRRTGTNAAAGEGPLMVAEADEYDYSFLQLTPDLAIITNIDFDHPDLFPDGVAYDAAFARFAAKIRRHGTLVMAADDAGCNRLRRALTNAGPRIVTFAETGDADWRLGGEEGRWRVTGPGGVAVAVTLAVPGVHNARNATAALAALVSAGYDADAAAGALGVYTGIGRRFELKGDAAGVTVIDDYAHHPSELRATLQAARGRFPDRRVWAVFQPHTFSRLKALLAEFAAAFADADRVMILDVYAARETDTLGVTAADLVARLPDGTEQAVDPKAAASRLAALVRPGDVVLTLGAGDVTGVGPRLLAALADSERSVAARGAKDLALRTISRLKPAEAEFDAAAARQSVADGEGPRRGGRTRPSPAGERFTIPGHPELKAMRQSPMSLHTTWRIGGPADVLVRAPTPAAVRAAIAWGMDEGMPITVIGGGSNLLVGDGGIRGLVILARTPGERAEGLLSVEDRGDTVRLRVAAQAPLSWTGRHAAEHGWAGLDWGVGLPGTIGGATVNNAGAHGTELKDHLAAIVVLNNDSGEIREETAAWLDPLYRYTTLKAAPRPRPFTVLESVFVLPKADPATLVRLADEHAAFRKETQPTGACAGSTFANPPGDFAGRLLEAAGLKGYQVGAVAFSAKHGNWIVNSGGATASDVRELVATARERIRDEFGISLRQEIEEIGEP